MAANQETLAVSTLSRLYEMADSRDVQVSVPAASLNGCSVFISAYLAATLRKEGLIMRRSKAKKA